MLAWRLPPVPTATAGVRRQPGGSPTKNRRGPLTGGFGCGIPATPRTGSESAGPECTTRSERQIKMVAGIGAGGGRDAYSHSEKDGFKHMNAKTTTAFNLNSGFIEL